MSGTNTYKCFYREYVEMEMFKKTKINIEREKKKVENYDKFVFRSYKYLMMCD